jgi:N-formylglutamate deformylase
MHLYEYSRGRTPLIVSMPHIGSFVPEDIRVRFSAAGRMVADTDWDLDHLYDFVTDLGTHLIKANYSRYVIDLNRDPDNRPLYPGINHPGLVPTHSFEDVPLYHQGLEPGPDQVAIRLDRYWIPYHDRLAAMLRGVKQEHGIAVLFDCHSIASIVPRYFVGRIPDLNLGTADGTSCELGLCNTLADVLGREKSLTLAVDGIFKGGYITRHYGHPANGIHAFQLEISRAAYMKECAAAPVFDPHKAKLLRPLLREMLDAASTWAVRKLHEARANT